MLGVVPRRYWARLDPPFPMLGAAFASGVATVCGGFAVGAPAFFTYSSALADANNRWLLDVTSRPAVGASDTAAGLVPYAISPFTLLLFLFTTPAGLFATYAVVSGGVRAIAAWFDDARGDFALSAADRLVTGAARRGQAERRRIARERREGADTPDVLKTGKWAGIEADYVLLSTRRKAEWTRGAIVMSSADWYRIGDPYDMETPSGLRTVYPLTRLETVEVVRRGIQYELPPLSGRPPSDTSGNQRT